MGDLLFRGGILFFITLSEIFDGSQAFCPHLSSPREDASGARGGETGRALYDSLSYYSDESQTCANNCFMNDGGNLDPHHTTDAGSTLSTFDVMASLSENDGGSDMCVFSFQELRLPNNEISAENLLELIYLGDNAGTRMHEVAKSSDNVLLAACTVGRIGAAEACSNAKRGVEGYDYFVADGYDDDARSALQGTATYYKDRFCKSAVRKTEMDHPQAVSIFRLNADDLEDAEAILGEWQEGHATNMQWASEKQIGASGHLLAKIVPCDQISERFKNPARMYQHLSDGNLVCDYVGKNRKQFVQEALYEWKDLCSVWPRNEDGSVPKCHSKKEAAAMWISLVVGLLGTIGIYFSYTILLRRMAARTPRMDNSELINELT